MEPTHPFIHQDLIESCRQGSRKAQTKIYTLYAKAMYNTSLRILNDPDEAEDAMQDAFISAFQNLDGYDGVGTFGSWLKRIVVNQSLDYLRRRKDTTPLEDESGIDMADESEEEDSEEILSRVAEIRQAMQQLPEEYRIILSLSLLEGYDHEEISQILQISYNNTRTRYSRARQKLLSLINENRLHKQITYN